MVDFVAREKGKVRGKLPVGAIFDAAVILVSLVKHAGCDDLEFGPPCCE